MKIGITIPYASVNYSGGINVQCRMWQQGLCALGHDAYLLNPWDQFDYENFDFLIIVGRGKLLYDFVGLYKRYQKPQIISAPVLDPNDITLSKFKIWSKYNGSIKLRYHTVNHDYYMRRNDFAFFLARSEFEKQYIVDGLGIPSDFVKIVPISMRLDGDLSFDLKEKGDYCFHVSRLSTYEKNVPRLIEAAKKYNFKLKLAGTLNGEKEEEWLKQLIGDSDNIEYIGWLDETALRNEYKRAKVLALPSINEGVGMVALEAAAYGCEICLTNLGGPKEYYGGRAVLVNPYDIDSIGNGVIEALTRKNAQPELSKFIIDKYSVEGCMKQLESYMLDYLEEKK